MSKVTVVGCGVMGRSLVNAFLNENHEVCIVDVNQQAAQPFLERGAKYEDELSRATDTDFILLNLPTHSTAMSVIASLGEDGLAGKAVINTTTASPKQVVEINSLVKSMGGAYLDATIECYPAEIGKETGYIVYSGDERVFRAAEEALSALAGANSYLGDNVVWASIIDLSLINVHYGLAMSLAESAALLVKNEFPMEIFLDHAKAAAPMAFDSPFRQMEQDLVHYTGEFEDSDEASLEIETNALGSIIQALQENGINTEYSGNIYKLLNEALGRGLGKKNLISVVQLFL